MFVRVIEYVYKTTQKAALVFTRSIRFNIVICLWKGCCIRKTKVQIRSHYYEPFHDTLLPPALFVTWGFFSRSP